MRTANPALKAFQAPQTWDDAVRSGTLDEVKSDTMSIGGTVTATGVLLGICVAGAVASWSIASNPQTAGLGLALGLGGLVAGLILGLIVSFKPKLARILGPLYAGAQGLLLGWFSFVVGGAVAGATGEGSAVQVGQTLVLQAVTLTFAITAGMLFAYASGLVRPGRVFRAVVMTGVSGAVLFFLVAMVMALLGNNTLIALYSPTNGGMLSVGFSVVLVVIASLMLVLDFELIAQGVRTGQPKHMEWYGGFALLVTLVWLYIELLRLVAKLRSGD